MNGARILIVDDDTANIRALTSLLGDSHEIRFATSGARALELAAADPPDLVLLDVVMPDLDGYAVCRRLKADPATADIPVIFITSLAGPEEEALGLEIGAVDYITKPFSPAIVRARVATHLSLRRANRRLRDENEHLESLVEERTRRLAQAQREKMTALRQIVIGVAHEINTPIGVALGSASHLADRVAELSQRLADGRLSRSDLDRFLESAADLAGLLSGSIVRAGRIVRYFKGVAADPGGVRQPVPLRPLLELAAVNQRPLWQPRGHRVAVSCPAGLAMESYPDILSSIIEQLLRNAVEHGYGEGEAGLITLEAAAAGEGTVRLTVADDGCGLPDGVAGRALEPFFTTRRATGSVGLGLTIIYNLVTDRLGGTLAITGAGGADGGASGGGTAVTIRLPARTPAEL
ncbi:hybrid sensor histidine kinase/response regulator [Azospirillum thermophilum]|uniref:histidine kinase n=1 Tax=Azospirillum thermophilum TaxID=2202148 RepID=A0A2S2CVJ9_9PROT|nr:response regulator [Azospirillum thermophilum]AWK88506.1 hybrid sensor histidine kinase/response regulator [Azospirillum thermophilum]